MDGWTVMWKTTPVSYTTFAFWGRCPKRMEGAVISKMVSVSNSARFLTTFSSTTFFFLSAQQKKIPTFFLLFLFPYIFEWVLDTLPSHLFFIFLFLATLFYCRLLCPYDQFFFTTTFFYLIRFLFLHFSLFFIFFSVSLSSSGFSLSIFGWSVSPSVCP